MSLLKTVRKYGNSGGIYVPRAWVGGKVRIELVEDPPNALADLIKKIPMEHVISIIVYGSHTRKEAEAGSDMDVLVVVDDDAEISVPQDLKRKFDIQIKTEGEALRGVANDPVFYKAMKDEGIALINHSFLDELKNHIPERKAVKTRLFLAESSLGIVKELLKFKGDNKDLVYPLFMRLKEVILLQYFLENMKYSLTALEKEARKHGISRKEFKALLDIYRAERDNRPSKQRVSDDALIKLVGMLEEKIEHVKKKTH